MAIEIANCILAGCKLFCDLCYPELQHIIKIEENKKKLDVQVEILGKHKEGITTYVEDGKRKGMVPSSGVKNVLQRIEKAERDYQDVSEKFDAMRPIVLGCCGNCKLLLELSRLVEENGKEMKTLCDNCEKYMDGEGVVVDPPPPMVEELPVPHVYGQQELINRIMRFLDDDGIRIIGVWGITGVGKTTIAKMVNNKLMGKETFVFFVTVKEEPDIKGIQNRIAERLGMSFGEHDSDDARKAALFRRLKDSKFLLILEDIHRKLDLDLVGVPHRSNQSKMSKVLLTTSNFEVCNAMSSDKTVEVDSLPPADAWSLFREKAGKVVERQEIKPLAEEIAKESEGLPKFLVLLGDNMRGKQEVGLWKNALREVRALRLTSVHSNWSMVDVEKEFRQLRDHYNRILATSTRLCFLYCCLFSRRYSVNVKKLVSYWRSEGCMEELNSSYSMGKGFEMIESLRNFCLLKTEDSYNSVMMLGLVRHMALRLAEEEGHKFFVRDEETKPLRQWPPIGTIPQDTQRISLMGHQIDSLEDQSQQEWSELSTLILQRNPLKSISDGFFHGMRALKVLDLSHTEITTLPSSISSLVNAQALYLGGCKCLTEMPPIGELRQLKLLDLSHTQIEELPQGLEKLSQLKTLILSYTSRLTSIRRGLMPCLSTLEELDMHQSAYSWGLEGMEKLDRATLEELSSLHKLEALYMNIQQPICLMGNEFADQWQMLSQFNFTIGEDIGLSRRHDRELHVINSDNLLPSETVKAVLRRSQALVLFYCRGITWISQVGGSFKDLKSLYIHGCDDVSSLIISGDAVDQDGAWEELEILHLQNLVNLESIWMGSAPRGRSLCNLRHITISQCPKLRSLFPISAFEQVHSLEEIQVMRCVSMEEVFPWELIEATTGGDGEIEEEARLPCLRKVTLPCLRKVTLPCLRKVTLEDLPRLKMLCKGRPSLPFLEVVRVKSCPLLKNLPIREVGEIQQIAGSRIWWKKLTWENEHIKSALERLFLDIGH